MSYPSRSEANQWLNEQRYHEPTAAGEAAYAGIGAGAAYGAVAAVRKSREKLARGQHVEAALLGATALGAGLVTLALGVPGAILLGFRAADNIRARLRRDNKTLVRVEPGGSTVTSSGPFIDLEYPVIGLQTVIETSEATVDGTDAPVVARPVAMFNADPETLEQILDALDHPGERSVLPSELDWSGRVESSGEPQV
jgi:hypothetical protein